MKKNAVIHVAYISNKEQRITVFSKNRDVLLHYLGDIQKENPFTAEKYQIYKDEIIIKSKLMNDIHAAIEKFDNNELFILREVGSEKELFTWIKIKGGSFTSNNICDQFLVENNLLNDWIDGKIKLEIYHSYEEISKEFGYRSKFNKEILNLTNSKIWELHKLFNGIINTKYEDFSKYSYTKECRISKIITDAQPYVLNDDWVKKISSTTLSIR